MAITFTPSTRTHAQKPRRAIRTTVLVALVALSSAFAMSAWARGDHDGRGGMHQTGMHGGGMGMHGGMGGRGLERMLDRVNASADQRAQIKQIAEAARNDMKAHREAGQALRQQGLALFAAPNVDANAVEAQRQRMLQHHDQASRRMTQAMVDISRVLTPEQRKQIAEQMQRRGDMMRRHMQERQQLDNKPKA